LGNATWFGKNSRFNARIVKAIPVDVGVITALRLLPPTFHADPADRIITATAIKFGMKLATKDRLILASGAVEIWSAD
jgi:PIN domain nuclease of toxin-antitoxin system